MKYRSIVNRKDSGFTLVELLVVIAIIGILATIVTPRVVDHIHRARVTKALTEIRNADTSLVAMLADTGRTNFQEFLTADPGLTTLRDLRGENPADLFDPFADVTDYNALQDFYNEFFYILLRKGRDLTVDDTAGGVLMTDLLVPEVRQKLATTYMDIQLDPWGNRYNFWMGPLDRPVELRSYRVLNAYDDTYEIPDSPDFIVDDVYQYNTDRRTDENDLVPGAPAIDGLAGYPADKTLPIYIFSRGPNLQLDSFYSPTWEANPPAEPLTGPNPADWPNIGTPEYWGGGDDINNWDSNRGWESAPR